MMSACMAADAVEDRGTGEDAVDEVGEGGGCDEVSDLVRAVVVEAVGCWCC